MKLEKEVKISEITRCPYYQPRLDDTFKVTLDNDNLSESEYEKLCKISKSKKIKLTLEVEKPILDEVERKYLSEVIRPFRDRVRYITKYTYDLDGKNKEYISIISYGWTINLPAFKKGTMYKNMRSYKEYTLDDLNL